MNRPAIAVGAGVGLLLALIAGTGVLPGDWMGADGELENRIESQDPGFEPWMDPLWEPPSTEIESLLFALQAASGALIIGYVMGTLRSGEKDGT